MWGEPYVPQIWSKKVHRDYNSAVVVTIWLNDVARYDCVMHGIVYGLERSEMKLQYGNIFVQLLDDIIIVGATI